MREVICNDWTGIELSSGDDPVEGGEEENEPQEGNRIIHLQKIVSSTPTRTSSSRSLMVLQLTFSAVTGISVGKMKMIDVKNVQMHAHALIK